jgi:hypothetical protein
MHEEEIEQANKREREEAIRHTYGYVDASGDVSIHVVLPPKSGVVGLQRGDCPLLWVNGSVQVVARHQKLGGRLLRDVCIADGCPEKYAMWLKAVSMRGKVEIKNVLDLYPPTVLRLRKQAATGVSLDMVFDGATGELVPATEDLKAARIADLLDGNGVGRPTEADRTDRKAAKA